MKRPACKTLKNRDDDAMDESAKPSAEAADADPGPKLPNGYTWEAGAFIMLNVLHAQPVMTPSCCWR